MSAIAGMFNLNDQPINLDSVEKLMGALAQFPADKVDTWRSKSVFLGCHAQWITPESINEPMPFYDYEKNLVITADAIIDNREELFAKLQIDQDRQPSIRDGELILIAYSKWGEEAPKHLIGDFSFVIWDGKKQSLFGARDFSGARTLYYYHTARHYVFSTTIEPLLTLPFIEKKLNEEWLAEFLAIQGMVEAVDPHSTVYASIKQVPASHSIKVDKDGINVKRYCRVSDVEKVKFKSNEEYEEAFQEVFQKAVRARTRTYGEVGSQLSGGLDSGTVAAFAAKELKRENKKLQAFSYIPEDGFEDWTPNYFIPNESVYIKETVNFIGNTDECYLDFKGKSPLTEVEDFLSLMEMPYKFFENSFWLKGINENAEKQGVKILLNGARGNFSISWGSRGTVLDYYGSLFKRLRWIKLYKELGLYCQNLKTGKSAELPKILKRAMPQFQKSLDSYQFPVLLNNDLAEKTGVYEKLLTYGENLTGFEKDQYEIRKTHFDQPFFWNKSGTATTKLSLRYGLWDRDPTNDLRVIRYCLAIPEEQYTVSGLERSLVRRATKNYLPEKVRLNHQSRGLQGADVIHRMLPDWSEFIADLNELTRDSAATEFLNAETIRNALKHVGNKPNPGLIFSDHFRALTRSLIVYRFLKKII